MTTPRNRIPACLILALSALLTPALQPAQAGVDNWTFYLADAVFQAWGGDDVAFGTALESACSAPASGYQALMCMRQMSLADPAGVCASGGTSHSSWLVSAVEPGVYQIRAHTRRQSAFCNGYNRHYYGYWRIFVDECTYDPGTSQALCPLRKRPCSNSADVMVGNPCNVASGNKTQRERDYQSPAGLTFVRTYNSLASADIGLGHGWTSNLHKRLEIKTGVVRFRRPDGSRELFTESGPAWQPPADSQFLVDADATGFTLTRSDGAAERYDLAGRIIWETDRHGRETSYTYNATGQLETVTGPFGHAFSFSYSNGHLAALTDPSGETISYAYDSQNRLIGVTYQDQSVRLYHYEYVPSPHLLTGITDGNGDRYATFAYNFSDQPILTEHAQTTNGVPQERFNIEYDSSTQTTVTDPAGHVWVYSFQEQHDVKRPISITSQSDGKSITQAFDANNNPISRTDEEGASATFTYNSANQRISMTEAAGTPKARTTTYEYLSPTEDLLTKVAPESVYGTGSDKETEVIYDSNRNATNVILRGYTPSGTPVSKATELDYNTSRQLIQIDGPRTDLSDLTTIEYYDCTTGAACGQIKKITNALGHVTSFDSYDSHGRLLQMTDPNGLVTSFTYDLRGRVLTLTEAPLIGVARVTTNVYDNAGQLASVSYPNGLILTYAYDAAHDLVSVTDNLGNSITYSYDTQGNRVERGVHDPSAVLSRTVDYTYDLRNRIDTINQGGFATDLLFDALGNLTAETDPASATTQHGYDELNRLSETIDALTGVADYAYDVNDNLISVTTPNGANTVYEYDDLDNLLEEISPDRGTTTYTHDAAGNVITTTDARGKVTTYTYDALNRLTEIELDNSDTITSQYDIGTNAIGRLSKVTDPSGETTRTYNNFGQVTAKTHKIGTITLTTAYGYDAGGRLTTMTLPSGKVVTYGYTDHLPVSVTVESTTILSGASYDPFGPVNSWTWGNSTSHSRSFDLRGLLESQSMVTDTRTLTYDDAGRLITLDDARHDLGFDYDDLGRVTDFTASGSAPLPASQSFTDDENGNRESITENGTPYTYSNVAYSNRLTSTTGPTAKNFTYDVAGNVTNDGIHGYGYDDRGRLVSVDSGAVTYQHNGQGQRVKKDDGSAVTLFAYDEAGQLIGEYDGSGNAIQETVWFNGMPAAVLAGSDEYYVHTDQLGTPRIITDGNTVIWRWESDPFGTTAAQEDPDGDLTDFAYNLRFPGQYYDEETGLHYNYYRTYDPSTGRYLESDPIGLGGGLNTYGYVGGNPLSASDPYGLDACYVLFPDYPITYSPGKTSTLLGGHAGILGYDDQGRTRYYEYGRYSPDRRGVFGEKLPSSRGNVRRQTIPDLEMGEDGQPTPESMERLKKALEDLAGKGTEGELSCDSEADEQKVYDFVEALANDKNRKDYNWVPFGANHCRTFAKQALRAGQ